MATHEQLPTVAGKKVESIVGPGGIHRIGHFPAEPFLKAHPEILTNGLLVSPVYLEHYEEEHVRAVVEPGLHIPASKTTDVERVVYLHKVLMLARYLKHGDFVHTVLEEVLRRVRALMDYGESNDGTIPRRPEVVYVDSEVVVWLYMRGLQSTRKEVARAVAGRSVRIRDEDYDGFVRGCAKSGCHEFQAEVLKCVFDTTDDDLF